LIFTGGSSVACSSLVRLAVLSCPFRVEGALAAPLPQHEPVAILACLRREFEHRAVEGGAIVVGEIDQAGFVDEAAQLYEG